MVICSCHVITDHEVRRVIEERPTMSQVYRSLGHAPHCGRCARTIRQMMLEAQASNPLATG